MEVMYCMASQEIESILDNPGEMADMHLADKEAALDAEAEQVQCRHEASLRCQHVYVRPTDARRVMFVASVSRVVMTNDTVHGCRLPRHCQGLRMQLQEPWTQQACQWILHLRQSLS